jgi:hypothetical protein
MSIHTAGFGSLGFAPPQATAMLRIAGAAILIAAAIAVSAILQGDVPDVVEAGTFWIGHILHRYTYLASYGLLYMEESGIPLPAPGDVFVMFTSARTFPATSLPGWSPGSA